VAYSPDDIKFFLRKLNEPARTIVATAALTGLRLSELRGLKWEDYDGARLWVRRNICFGRRGEMTVELPKTEASKSCVPVIAPLRQVLDAWKMTAQATAGCWIFPAGFVRSKNHPESLLDAARMTPLSPANCLRDKILPALNVVLHNSSAPNRRQ